jgi:hypothetical protein
LASNSSQRAVLVELIRRTTAAIVPKRHNRQPALGRTAER